MHVGKINPRVDQDPYRFDALSTFHTKTLKNDIIARYDI